MKDYQLIRFDPYSNVVVESMWVQAATAREAVAQRPADWPRSETRASSRGPFA